MKYECYLIFKILSQNYQKSELSNCHGAKTTGARTLIFWTHACLTKDFLNTLRDQCNKKYVLNVHGKTHIDVAVVGTYLGLTCM